MIPAQGKTIILRVVAKSGFTFLAEGDTIRRLAGLLMLLHIVSTKDELAMNFMGWVFLS